MSKPEQESNIDGQMVEDGILLLRAVQRFNLILLAILVGASWLFHTWSFAQSVLIGGVLVNASHFMLRRDIREFIDNFSRSGANWKAVRRFEKIKFFLKFYARLLALAAVLYFLITKFTIDVIGLVVGLSTIMFSVIVVVLSKGSVLYSAQRYKGA